MLDIPLSVAGAERLSADQIALTDVAGLPFASVSHAPPLLVRRLLAGAGALPPAPEPEARLTAIAKAGQLFATAELAGQTPQAYCHDFARATGIPAAIAAAACDHLRDLTSGLAEVVPPELQGRVDVADGVRAAVHRVPRGRMLGVIAPSNHPATHGSWLRAVAYGMQVAIRPGSRDPFTPLRMARALNAAFGGGYPLYVLNGPYQSAELTVRLADLALVYGRSETTAAYSGRSSVAVRGPGRSKAILSGTPSDSRLDFLARAVAGDAGVRCTNISAVLTDQQPAKVAEAIIDRIGMLPVHPATDERAVLPVFPLERAEAIRRQIDDLARAGTKHEPAGGMVADLGDGTAAVRGAVITLDRLDPIIGTELPFPFVVVAPWSSQDGLTPVRHCLALVLLGDAERLAGAALAEPSIRKVLIGPVLPWHSTPALPHDGHLADFLLESRAVLSIAGADR